MEASSIQNLLSARVGIIGSGAIGGIFVERLLAVGLPAAQLVASETRPERRLELQQRYRIAADLNAEEVAQFATIVIVAVPPSAGPDVLSEIALHAGPDHLVVSVMGGIPLTYLEEKLPRANVVRMMPNSPSLIGQGFNPVACGERVTPAARRCLDELLVAFGSSVSVPDAFMNMMTALPAVGPTYVLPVLDAMITAAEEYGLDRATAVRCAVATVVGTALTVEYTGLSPDEVKLFTGLRPLRDAEVKGLIAAAIAEALQRMNALERKFAP